MAPLPTTPAAPHDEHPQEASTPLPTSEHSQEASTPLPTTSEHAQEASTLLLTTPEHAQEATTPPFSAPSCSEIASPFALSNLSNIVPDVPRNTKVSTPARKAKVWTVSFRTYFELYF